DANQHVGADTINVQVPGTGPQTIQPLTALPAITDPVVLDGTTQNGYTGTPLVELDGSNAGANVSGLVVTAGNSTVRGLVINRFTADGLVLATNGGDLVKGNYFGTDVAGNLARPNGVQGLLINNTPSNQVGGTAAGEGNLISGNATDGLQIAG